MVAASTETRPKVGPQDDEAGDARVRAALEDFLRQLGYVDPMVDAVESLRGQESDGYKAMGYGSPVRVRFHTTDDVRDLVFRTASTNAFGHEYRADRWSNLMLSADTFGSIPHHVKPVGFGIIKQDGVRLAIPEGEPFLVTTFVEGRTYARDLERLASTDEPRPDDVRRAERLGRYLAELHQTRESEVAYRRALRDVIGHGEGIFGLTESYSRNDPIAPPSRLQHLECRSIEWRWRLLRQSRRARRIHGDFHPFNIMFGPDGELGVLDCSRGAAGDPADDLAALSINYIFFALRARGRFVGALRSLWRDFWQTYLDESGDRGSLEVIPLYYAWRALVLASPAWYPDVTSSTRDCILSFAERLLAGDRFDPDRVEEVMI